MGEGSALDPGVIPSKNARTHPPQIDAAVGADLCTTDLRAGYDCATMTLDLYGHLYADRLDEIADRMDAARTARLAKSRTSAQDHADFCGLAAS